MESGYCVPNSLPGVENFEDGDDIKMSEVEEGELVEMISKTELGENSGVASNTTELQETRVGTENKVDKDSGGKNQKHRKNKKKKKKNRNRGKKGPSDADITDIDRFVKQVCWRLREKKSYLVYTAVACLGVSALCDLVKEVEAIQACGGQKTTDGQRLREAGGVLWNIIRVRDPNAFKEIMKRGKEIEKQFKQVPRTHPIKKETKPATKGRGAPANALGGSNLPSRIESMLHDSHEPSTSGPKRQPVHNRIRTPVSYDDLYEEERPKDVHCNSTMDL